MHELLEPKDAAKAAGMSQETLRRAEKAGLIKPLRTPGGHRRYRRSEIEALLTREAS